ncbi:uncharacterized protein PFL1_06567 [Pseudozyma flocculosa PF-1]|uniref:Structural maintenance of chromosomes protein 4 n=2 Tax=Pseudozyma flocculosa TaxID=84751 RepID=A0A5C3FAA8_9BASI|nr:uncharacterized protein PFL1_06567 [Pseudozyma flocculosa PF-1]EPQ25894.1 hypothetical protein PFL1_06567 [Pseudozyma flocculosa PF-1]SPO40605.1 related to SMC4 - Stable Maintenance of Chromosomes [Pseudozyma flocculosa]
MPPRRAAAASSASAVNRARDSTASTSSATRSTRSSRASTASTAAAAPAPEIAPAAPTSTTARRSTRRSSAAASATAAPAAPTSKPASAARSRGRKAAVIESESEEEEEDDEDDEEGDEEEDDQEDEDEEGSEEDDESEEEEEEEEEEVVKPRSRGRAAAPASSRKSAQPAPAAKKAAAPARAARGTKRVLNSDAEDSEQSSDEEDEADRTLSDEADADEVEKSLLLDAAPMQPGATAAAASAGEDDDSEAETEDSLTPPPKRKRPSPEPTAAAAAPKSEPAHKQQPAVEQGSDDESDSSEASFKEAEPGVSPGEGGYDDEAAAADGVETTPKQGSPTAAVLQQATAAAAATTPPKPAGPLKRLIIHKMVLNNFKSYAGRQEIGPFHKSFSSVVGPNGSGKSNVIDSLLFVFGWRANKMRQGKLSELIHNSAGRENLPNCSVEVWFREIVDLPGEAYKVVPNSKLVVSRTAFRNNASQYSINGRKSTFTEVTTLLKGRGIDLDHKRFLILQGEVESIAQMPPKAKNEHEEGLLEYLEDIIGTSEFKVPIEEQAKLVDEANERRAEKLARLKIVQKEKDALESKKRQAEEYLRDQNELTQRQSALWQVYILECRDQMSVASQAIESLRARIAEETEKHAGSKAEIEALEKEYEAVVQDYEAIAKSADKVIKELAKYEKEDVQLQEKRKHLETKRKKCTKSVAEDKHAASEARSTASNSTEEIEKVSAELARLEASLEKEEAELERVRDSLKEKTQGFSAAIEKKQKELQPWVAKVSEKAAARDVAREERDLLDGRSAQIEKSIDEAKEALRNLELDNESKGAEVENLKQERKDLAKKIASSERQLADMRTQEAELRKKAGAARSKADEAKASVTANRSRGDVLSSLTRQAELGMIKGFHGRLGNLGTIDDRYDVAISTACPGLNNIVVETVETGQACIEHLRKNNLGRGNFIVLNSLGISKAALAPIDTPEDVPRLFDLVKPRDERFAAAFYHQLRDTLVAKDLAHANRIAYGAKRWRVVTLDGQLIDKSGTMSGGGNRVSRGAMSSKLAADDVSPEQLQRMERDRDAAEEMLRGQLTSILTVEQMLDDHRRRAPQIDMALDKIGMDLGIGEKRVAEAKQRVAELKAQSKPDAADAKRIAELDKQIAAFDKDIAKLSEKTEAIEADIAALQEKILEAGGVALRMQKSKVDGIKEMLDLSSERITKAEVAKSKAEKDVKKLEAAMARNQQQLDELEREVEELMQTIEAKTRAAESVRAKVAEAQDVMETKQEERDDIKAQLDERSESVNAFRALEMEIKQKLEDNERSLHDNEKRLKHWQDKHAQLTLHEIDGDDEEDDDEGEGEQDGAGEAKKKRASDDDGQDQDQDDNDDDDEGPLELQEYPEDELRAIDKESIKAEIVVYEEKVAKGQGNLSVLAEYRKREGEFLQRARDLEATTEERDSAKRRYDDLRKQRLENFMAGFGVITAKLKEMYQTITLGGNAELELVDSLDPFSEGIIFSVMPPKKSWKNISNLSGGEKTLSSLALVFALHVFKPTPLYVMDEIDAALDFRNVSIVANLIKERTKGAQFIIISLRNNMFELSSRLVGVYKTANCTKSIAIDNRELGADEQQQQQAAAAAAARDNKENEQGLRHSQSMMSFKTPARAGPGGLGLGGAGAGGLGRMSTAGMATGVQAKRFVSLATPSVAHQQHPQQQQKRPPVLSQI